MWQLNGFLLELKQHILHGKSQLANRIAINQLQKLELKVGQQLKGNAWAEFDMIMASGNSSFIHVYLSIFVNTELARVNVSSCDKISKKAV